MAHYNERNLKYQTSMFISMKMLQQGIISTRDLSKINTILAKKYDVDSSSIYAINSLINTPKDGNMSHT